MIPVNNNVANNNSHAEEEDGVPLGGELRKTTGGERGDG
jgi:hypothetical protein